MTTSTHKQKMGRPGRSAAAIAINENWRDRKKRVAANKKTVTREVGKRSRISKLIPNCRERIPGYDPWGSKGDCEFDEVAAKDAIKFFQERLTHVKGELARKSFKLEAWQHAIIGNLFGWKRKNGTRRYREAYIQVGRKNGKTPMAAGILVYMLFEDGEPGAEIYGAASEYRQASLVFEHARGMVLQEPGLRERSQVYNGQAKSVMLGEETGFSTYRVISSDASTSHGFNTHAAVIDELHTQANRDLVDALMTSTGARRNPLIVHITTAGYDKNSICHEKYDYACKVRDGLIDDPSFLPVIFEASADDDWTDPKVWAKANPNLGISVSREYLVRECKRAQETPSYENTFKRLHLNLWTEQETRWLPMDKWDACGTELDVDSYAGRACYGGLDLATTTDLTCLSLVFPPEAGSGGGTDVMPFFWIPEENARERERRDRVPYSQWERQGLLVMTPGNVTDYDRVRADIVELGERYGIQSIAYDPWNATQLVTQLGMEDGFLMVQHRQGTISMSAPSKEFERLVISGKLNHGNNPILRWQASNVAVKSDGNDLIRPVKPEHKSALRIDGIVATIMGLSQCMVRVDTTSVYEERGVLVV